MGSRLLYDRWYAMVHYRRGSVQEICAEWLTFSGFAADVPEPPDASAVLVRRDRTKPFGPSNVRWGTERDRRQMSAHVRLITFRGKSQSITAWAEELGIDRCSLGRRLEWLPPAKALKLPKRPRRRPRKPKSPHASSRHVGVGRHSGCDRWEAKIRVKGKLEYLGLYPTERGAANAVATRRAELAALKHARRVRDLANRGARIEKLFDELQELTWLARVTAHHKALGRRLEDAWKFGRPMGEVRPLVDQTRGQYHP